MAFKCLLCEFFLIEFLDYLYHSLLLIMLGNCVMNSFESTCRAHRSIPRAGCRTRSAPLGCRPATAQAQCHRGSAPASPSVVCPGTPPGGRAGRPAPAGLPLAQRTEIPESCQPVPLAKSPSNFNLKRDFCNLSWTYRTHKGPCSMACLPSTEQPSGDVDTSMQEQQRTNRDFRKHSSSC